MTDRLVKPYFETIDQLEDVSSSLAMPVKVAPSSVVSYKLNDQSGSNADSPSNKLTFQRNFAPGLAINRCMILESTCYAEFRDTYSGAGGVYPTLHVGGAVGPLVSIKDAYPLQKCLSSLSVSVNSNPLNYESGIFNTAFAKMVSQDDKAEHQDGTAIKNNTCASYNAQDPAYAGIESSFTDRLKGNSRFEIKLVSVAPVVAGANDEDDACVVKVQITLREPLLHPYLSLSSEEGFQGAFTQLHSLAVDMNVQNSNSPFVFRTRGNATAVATKTYLGKSYLYVLAYQPPVGMTLPKRNCIPMLVPSYAPQSVPAIADGDDASIESPVRNLSRCPEYMVVYFRKKAGGALDHSLAIQEIALNWDNKSNLLTDFSQWQLYDMSKRAGCEQSWDEFRGSAMIAGGTASTPTVGSYMVIPVAELASQLGTSPGVVGSKDCSIRVSVKNTSGANITNTDIEMIFATLDPAVFVTEEGSSRIVMDLLSQGDVIKSLEAHKQEQGHFDARYIGGNWLSKLGKGLKRALPTLKKLGSAGLKFGAMTNPDPRSRALMEVGAQALGSGTVIASGLGRVNASSYLPKNKDNRFK